MSASQNISYSGLGTVTYVAIANGIVNFQGTLTLPTLVGDISQPVPPSSVPAVGSAPVYQSPSSQVVVTVNKNGSPVYTGKAGANGFQTSLLCAITDVITVVLSSSAACDQVPNLVKANIGIWS